MDVAGVVVVSGMSEVADMDMITIPQMMFLQIFLLTSGVVDLVIVIKDVVDLVDEVAAVPFHRLARCILFRLVPLYLEQTDQNGLLLL